MRLGNSSGLLSATLFHFKIFYRLLFVISMLSLAGCDHDDDDDNDENPDTNITANAGVDQQVTPQAIVTLPGSGSTDNGTISSYAWTQTSGDIVSLLNSDNATASFTSPSNPVDNVLTFELTVTGSESNFATDTVDITVQVDGGGGTIPPTAEAGSDKAAMYGDVVNLFGIGTDSDGSIVSYQWQQTSGETVTLINPTFPTTKFTVPNIEASDLVFELTVTDNDGLSATDIVTVSIEGEVVEPPIDGEALFESECGDCHIGNGLGSGTIGRDLTGYTFEQLSNAPDSMIGHLTDPELQAIADALVPEIIDGEALFESECGDCHIGNGLGSGTIGRDLTGYTFEQLSNAPDSMIGHLTDPELQAIADALVPEIIDGEALFESECGDCHIGNGLGSGTIGRDLTGYTFEQLSKAPDSMIGHLTDPELQAIADALVPEIIDGVALFETTCGTSGCHTANGHGVGTISDKTHKNVAQIEGAIASDFGGMGAIELTAEELLAIELAISNTPQFFAAECSTCHGFDELADKTPEQISWAIGKFDPMMIPDYEVLNERQLLEISDYLVPLDGTALFDTKCGHCHTVNEIGVFGDKTNKNAQQIRGAIDDGKMTVTVNDAELHAIELAITNIPELFIEKCSSCHSKEEKGDATFEQIKTAIANNAGDEMGVVVVNDRQIQVISDYLALDGEQIFTSTCGASCHTANGLGPDEPIYSDKTNKNVQQILDEGMEIGPGFALNERQVTSVEVAITDPQKLLQDSCSGSSCHDPVDVMKENATVEEITTQIGFSMGNGAPNFTENLNPRQIQVIADELINGETLFVAKCGGCHIANGFGTGTIGFDKTNKNFEQITGAIANNGSMKDDPTLTALTPRQIEEIAIAISSPADLFDTRCGAACHTKEDLAGKTAEEITNVIRFTPPMLGDDEIDILDQRQIQEISNFVFNSESFFESDTGCGFCHAGNGYGNATTPTDLTDKSFDELKAAIIARPTMGDFAHLSDFQIAEIANLMKSPDGVALYEEHCDHCHVGNGMDDGGSYSDRTNSTVEQITNAIFGGGDIPNGIGMMSDLNFLRDVEISALSDALFDAESFFATPNCGMCHIGNGYGTPGWDITDRTFEQLKTAITEAVSMPDFTYLSDYQILEITALITDGEAIFEGDCGICHSGNGMGQPHPGNGYPLTDFTFEQLKAGPVDMVGDRTDAQLKAIADALLSTP
ncbi:hypothetical protein RGQ13_17410 [Thalassotalea psychrophila]|uniref:Cytochrome c domain-containing protein n=1 Tax=Thalassotalea psychrophila TaxID=3065647 RepID=A0ABY9TU81_9GAMM|nr:hypothetical protein RGQ13_17410 [Colwelliaceae bacterium SQ149]